MSASELDVLHCDNHLLVVNKPAGVPTVPDKNGRESVLDVARDWVRREFKKPGNVFLGVVHRLDQPVSGVLVFARTSKAAARLSSQLREREAHKLYWGISANRPREDAGVLEQWLAKDGEKNRVRVVRSGTPDAKLAITKWRVLDVLGEHTLLELLPSTGRAHQLRMCAATLGAPLLGDLKYGAPRPLADKSIALHAREIELEHPTRGERLRFTASVPSLDVWRLAARYSD